MKLLTTTMVSAAALAVAMGAAEARNAPGVTAKEIKIGNTNPYSGPAAAYSSPRRISAMYDLLVHTDAKLDPDRFDNAWWRGLSVDEQNEMKDILLPGQTRSSSGVDTEEWKRVVECGGLRMHPHGYVCKSGHEKGSCFPNSVAFSRA